MNQCSIRPNVTLYYLQSIYYAGGGKISLLKVESTLLIPNSAPRNVELYLVVSMTDVMLAELVLVLY